MSTASPPVLLLELGFPAELGRGVFVLSRSVGICAHALEQMQQGHRIKGPTPPEAGFKYTGARAARPFRRSQILILV